MRIFIAASAKENIDLEYRTLATDVATILVRHQHKLLFTGQNKGMLEQVFMTYKYEGGKVKAIVDVHDAKNLDAIEVDAYDVEPSTFERTKKIYQSADMVIALPGDIEVLGELFGILEEKRKQGLTTPVILFNYRDFYTPFLKFIYKSYEHGFLDKEDLKLFSIVNDLDSLEKYIEKIKEEN